MVEHSGKRRADEFRRFHERTALRRHAPDAAVRLVAARVAEVHLAVLDDRVVPVGDVDRSVGPHLHVDRAEGHVVRLDHFDFLTRGVPGRVFGDYETTNPMGSEVVRDHVAAPIFR